MVAEVVLSVMATGRTGALQTSRTLGPSRPWSRSGQGARISIRARSIQTKLPIEAGYTTATGSALHRRTALR
jgi:hypothetical protein